jgi:hypothetical protein
MSVSSVKARLLAEHLPAYSRALTLETLIAWGEAHVAVHGRWPKAHSGAVLGAPGERWGSLDMALRCGSRGLPAGLSVAKLFSGRLAPGLVPVPVKEPRVRLRRPPTHRIPLTVDEILTWADAHRERTRKWPSSLSGPVVDAPFPIAWCTVARALHEGLRGLPGGSSLKDLLAEHRNFRQPLTAERILAWADAYHAAHGHWPYGDCQPKEAAPGMTWKWINQALHRGYYGLSGGTSLTEFLVAHRGPEADPRPPRLSMEQILAWADAYHAAHGRWPGASSGAIPESPGDTWRKIHVALQQGVRGLVGSTSLPRLLEEHRGARNRMHLPSLSVDQILAWADAHHAATGRWPTANSGPVAAAPGETWNAVHLALYHGTRGLPGGMTLPRVLADRKPPRWPRPPLTLATIQTWARQHWEATGSWPARASGPVAGVPGEQWSSIARALERGLRSLPRGLTLRRVIGAPPQSK